MKPLEALDLYRVWVNPTHTVRSARALMREHRISALPVVDGAYLMGMVSGDRLSAADERQEVEGLMQAPSLVLESDQTARDAASRLIQHQLDMAPVIREGRFLGLLTSTMLLGELTQSFDPMTGLSWQDALRSWGVSTLRSGREITILFIDLDDFGVYNKRYGHTVGDKVIRKVSGMLKSACDPSSDMLVRYGGDEFAIGTTRSREDAERLAQAILNRQIELHIDEADQSVNFSLGIFGGKRSGWREEDHLEATVDNLINLASKAALEAKRAKKAAHAPPQTVYHAPAAQQAPPAPTVSRSQFSIADVQVDEDIAQATVTLRSGDALYHGVQARGEAPSLSVAFATARAIEEANPNLTLTVLDVAESATGASTHVEALIGNIASRGAGNATFNGEGKYRAIASAVLESFEKAVHRS